MFQTTATNQNNTSSIILTLLGMIVLTRYIAISVGNPNAINLPFGYGLWHWVHHVSELD